MDFSTLKTRVSEILEDTSNAQWSAALVGQYVNDAARDFARDTKCIKKLSAALSAAATTPANAFYTLPTDLLEIESVWWNGEHIPFAAAVELPYQWDTQTGSTPFRAIYGDFGTTELRVYPYPSSALTTLKVYYTAVPAAMSGNSDTPTGIPSVYHIALVYGAVAMCYRRNFEDADRPKAAEFFAMYQHEVVDCIARTGRRFTAGGLVVPYRDV